jgi:hypothetical protein
MRLAKAIMLHHSLSCLNCFLIFFLVFVASVRSFCSIFLFCPPLRHSWRLSVSMKKRILLLTQHVAFHLPLVHAHKPVFRIMKHESSPRTAPHPFPRLSQPLLKPGLCRHACSSCRGRRLHGSLHAVIRPVAGQAGTLVSMTPAAVLKSIK